MARPAARTNPRPSRSTARLAAVQALYQHEMAGTPLPRLLTEFETHRLREMVDLGAMAAPDAAFFHDVVAGTAARAREIDELLAARLAEGWTLDRLDRPMRAVLRAGAYELIARPDVPVGSIISEYLNVAHAFCERRETAFVNGVLDAVAREVRRAA